MTVQQPDLEIMISGILTGLSLENFNKLSSLLVWITSDPFHPRHLPQYTQSTAAQGSSEESQSSV